MLRKATLSECGRYRVALTREHDQHCEKKCCAGFMPNRRGYVVWVLNNPSTADSHTDDPTVLRAWGFTKAWGYGAMMFVNTNPFRATNPAMAQTPDAYVMMMNDGWLRHAMEISAITVCGWGDKANEDLARHAFNVMHTLGPLHALRVTKAGNPQHPLYLASTCKPQLWRGERYQQ